MELATQPSAKKPEKLEPSAKQKSGKATKYTTGYDSEHGAAYRYEGSKSKKPTREWAVEWLEPSDKDPLKPMGARFGDGVVLDIEGLLYGAWKQKEVIKKRAREFYEHVHVISGHKIQVVVRPDRKLLISMKEQNRQPNVTNQVFLRCGQSMFVSEEKPKYVASLISLPWFSNQFVHACEPTEL